MRSSKISGKVPEGEEKLVKSHLKGEIKNSVMRVVWKENKIRGGDSVLGIQGT